MQLYDWKTATATEKKAALSRPLSSDEQSNSASVKQIIATVQQQGDAALFSYAEKFDKVVLRALTVTEEEKQQAFASVNKATLEAIQFAKTRIEKVSALQMPSHPMVFCDAGVHCERQARPIDRVGLYIPGGSAPLVSTVLMLGVPAAMANCPLRILCTPPNQNGSVDATILVAATLCGIQQIYKVGGAQAIAAMAYGTTTIPKIDKLFGPGNQWVTTAKRFVAQDLRAAVSIDMPAGPSEVMVIADSHANPIYVAADLLSQAEHGEDSQVMLVTTCSVFANTILNCIAAQLKNLPRGDIAKKSLAQSKIIIVQNIDEAISVSNLYAPEHLILQVRQPQQYISAINNAAAVFVGPWSAEALGDYVTGSNHVLPTNGYARQCSGLSVVDFLKFISIQTVTHDGLEKMAPFAQQLAEVEGLHAHKNALSLRLVKEVVNE